jgi:hypothetical protein
MIYIFSPHQLLIYLQLLPQQLVNGSESNVGPRGLAPPPPPNQIQTPKIDHPSTTSNILSQLEHLFQMKTTKARKSHGQTQQTKSRPSLVLALPLQTDALKGQGRLPMLLYSRNRKITTVSAESLRGYSLSSTDMHGSTLCCHILFEYYELDEVQCWQLDPLILQQIALQRKALVTSA